MTPLVELEVGKQYLHVTHVMDDDNLAFLLERASALVLDYMKVDADTYEPAGSPAVQPDVPSVVQIATLLALRSLYEDPEADPITPAVVSVLRRLRDPALA